jgi:hypothetical protein
VTWVFVAVVYFAYLTLVAWMGAYPLRLRLISAVALLGALTLLLLPSPDEGIWLSGLADLAPLAVLLGGYRLSGLFFVAPMTGLECRLLAIDARLFALTGWDRHDRRVPAGVGLLLELSYLLVHAVVPLGVLALHLASAADEVPTYWTVVFAACFASYAMLPWIQTRPPRSIEAPRAEPASALRRLNLAILRTNSTRVNTVPSGHAAAALAAALVVGSAAPAAGLVFLTLAIGIAVATVVGRYHYALDTVAGLAVALGSWALLG